MQTSLNLKFTHKPLLLIPLPPQESPRLPPSSSLTWSLHSSARAFPVLWVMGGQRFDKPIKGPHVRTIEASDGLCHPFPQSACLSAPSDWHVLSAWYLTPTLRTFNNPHVSQSTTRTPPQHEKMIWSSLPVINMSDKSVSPSLQPLVSPAVGGRDAGPVPRDPTSSRAPIRGSLLCLFTVSSPQPERQRMRRAKSTSKRMADFMKGLTSMPPSPWHSNTDAGDRRLEAGRSVYRNMQCNLKAICR